MSCATPWVDWRLAPTTTAYEARQPSYLTDLGTRSGTSRALLATESSSGVGSCSRAETGQRVVYLAGVQLTGDAWG